MVSRTETCQFWNKLTAEDVLSRRSDAKGSWEASTGHGVGNRLAGYPIRKGMFCAPRSNDRVDSIATQVLQVHQVICRDTTLLETGFMCSIHRGI